ncbi:MAG: glycerophosphodiester phosphodiesterase [Oscillospiraceae bacterium]|jgi:glycerophosphoryl diester phosphodiesterase|nr:glycerophosphodiester phosphodiesterase [Oscillospiraceae bacterium]
MPVQIWAHRGDSHNAPENTLSAFQLAIDAGADGVELDAQRTADGVPVVCHDDSIDRCSNGTGEVNFLKLAELRGYDHSCRRPGFAGETIPTLEESLALMASSGLQLNIELKKARGYDPGLAPAALELAIASGMMDRVVFSSFEMGYLETIRSLSRDARVAILIDIGQRAPWDFAKTINAEALHAPLARVRMSEFIDRAHDEGMLVRLWTVDAPAAIARSIRQGVDGIITNRPGQALKARKTVVRY